MVQISIVYIDKQLNIFNKTIEVTDGCTVHEALVQSTVFDVYPETKTLDTGIFSNKVEKSRVVKQGDRIEIYRPLTIDPMEKRRMKAKNQG